MADLREQYIAAGLIRPAVRQDAAFFEGRGFIAAAAAMRERGFSFQFGKGV